MRTIRTLLSGTAVLAVAVTALAVPAAAADTQGTLALVNGIPGKRVDVCINGNEIKSGLRYGKAVLRDVISTGNKNLKFYERDPRTCRGKVLAKETFPVGAGDDFTFVATKHAPKKVVTFDDAGLGEIPPLGAAFPTSYLIWRNASELPVNFRFRYWSPNPEVPTTPTADAIFGKGQEHIAGISPDYVFQIRARLPEAAVTLVLDRVLTAGSHRYEWTLVGTNPGNAKFVVLDRVVSFPSP